MRRSSFAWSAMRRSIKRARPPCFVRDTVDSAVSDGAFPNADVTVTGAPYFLKDINDYLKGGMLQLGAIAVVVMMIILLVLFKVRWRLLPLLVILLGVIWAFGLAGYLGIPLTLVTIAGLPVMLGIGIDYAIQMHARVEEEVIIDRAEHPIQATARGLGPALLVVTFDAVFAFTALQIRQGADDPPVRHPAGRRHHRHLLRQHHHPARDPRHP